MLKLYEYLQDKILENNIVSQNTSTNLNKQQQETNNSQDENAIIQLNEKTFKKILSEELAITFDRYELNYIEENTFHLFTKLVCLDLFMNNIHLLNFESFSSSSVMILIKILFLFYYIYIYIYSSVKLLLYSIYFLFNC